MKVNESYALYHKDPSPENYNQLGESLYAFIKAIIAGKFGNRYNLLKEAVGESVCNILGNLNSFKPDKNTFAMWVYTIVYNTCIDMLRTNSKNNAWELLPKDGTIDPDYLQKIQLKASIKKLDYTDQRLVRLKLAGFKNLAIGDEMGLTEKAVERKWCKIISRLRTLMGGDNDENK